MARGRMLANTIVDDKRFNELTTDAALVYLMTIPQLDRDGLILGEPMLLWGQVCRRRPALVSRMADIITELVSSGLVTAYKTKDGDIVLHFVGFQKNQSMTHYNREAESRFPCPPGYVRTDKGLTQDGIQQYDIDTVDSLRIHSGFTPDVVLPNVIQINSNEVKCNEKPSPAVAVPTAQPTLLPAQEKIKRARRENPDKAHPAVQAYFDLHKRWPQNAQIALIVERDPPIANWVRAIRTWAGKGYNPQNIAAMLDWAENPSKIDKAANGYTTQDGKYIATNGAADDDDIPTYKKLAVLA